MALHNGVPHEYLPSHGYMRCSGNWNSGYFEQLSFT